MNADMQLDEKTKKIAYEAGILEGLETNLRLLTDKVRNECTAGELADILLKAIENGRRQCANELHRFR